MRKKTIFISISLGTICLVLLFFLAVKNEYSPNGAAKDYEGAYKIINNKIYLVDGNNLVLTTNDFKDGFENASDLPALFLPDLSRWHSFTAETDDSNEEIQRLTICIITRDCDFPKGGNALELTSEKSHSGQKALKFYAAPAQGKTASKASITRQLTAFVKGDDVYFSGWYYLVGATDARDVFLWDLEAEPTAFYYRGSPGRRLYIQEGAYLASDLGKWFSGQVFRQARGKEVIFPRDTWTNIKIHLYLSEGQNGVMEVWQDGVKVLDAKGQTLPEAKTVYGHIELGITANGNTKYSQTLYLDDIAISDHPL